MLGEHGDPVVMDFGLARRVNTEDSTVITRHGTAVGSPAYMSPEQVEGDPDKLTPATDQYSLGVILYQLLTSRRPFGGGLYEVMHAIVHHEPPPPSRHRPGLDPRLEAVCLRMLSKRAADRFASMSEMAEALADIVTDSLVLTPRLVFAGRGTEGEGSLDDSAPREQPRRMPVMWIAMGMGIVGLLAVMALLAPPGSMREDRNSGQPQDTAVTTGSTKPDAASSSASASNRESNAAPAPVDPAQHHRAAELIRELGGSVVIEREGARSGVFARDALPRDGFILREISLHKVPPFDESLFAVFDGLNGMEKALLYDAPVGDVAVGHLARCPSLWLLHLARTGVSDDGVEALSRSQSIRELILHLTRVTENCYPHLARLTLLKQFDLGHIPYSDRALGLFESLPNLETMNVHHDWSNDAVIQRLSRHATFASFGFFGDATPDEVARLRSLPHLYSIYFSAHPGLTREVIAALKGFNLLHRVGIADSQVASNALEALPIAESITDLALMRVPLRDAQMEPLSRMKLKSLLIQGTLVTRDGIALLQTALRQCVITTDLPTP